MGLVATFARGDTATGVKPLDMGDGREDPTSGMVFGLEQEPRNRPWDWSIGTLEHGPDDGAPILALPGRTGEVVTDDLTTPIEELGVRGFERPDEGARVVGVGLAGVDLDAASAELKDQYGTVRGSENGWNRFGTGGCFLSGRRPGNPSHHRHSSDESD
jgi:hypothetical protein